MKPIKPLVKKTKKVAGVPPVIDLRYFYLERPKLGLKFKYELNNEHIMNMGGDSEDTVGEFREGGWVSTKGWVYHPVFLDFVLDLEPEWNQSSDNTEYNEMSSDRSFLNQYALDADLLPLKPYTVHFFGRKYQNSFRNTFSQRAVVDTDTYGSRLDLKYKILPTSLSYSNTKVERRGALFSSQDHNHYDLAMNHRRKNSITRLNANYRDIQQTNEGESTGIATSNNYLTNTYFFQSDQSKKLMSDLVYNWMQNSDQDDSVTFTTSDLRWTEELHWTHRKNLWTNYKFLNQKQQTDESDIDTQSLAVSLQHLLYENLTTTVDGKAGRFNYSGDMTDVYTGRLNFDYSRNIPWGTLNSTLGFDLVATDRDSTESWIWAINESHTATTADVIFTQQENVDPDSIRVTDKSGTIVYIQGQDYTVEVTGKLVRIRPTLVGNITEGQELLVSYRYRSISGYDDLVFGRWAGINIFLWSTLRLSYDYNRRTQDIISGTEPESPVDDTFHRAQARVIWKWTDTTVSYDVYETTLSSARKSWRVNEQLRFQPARGVVLEFSGYIGNTIFTYSDDREEFYRAATSISWHPVYWCRTGFEAYQYEISGGVQDASNAGALASIDLYYGQWTCNLSYRYLDHTDEMRDFDRARQSILLKISRTIW